METNEGNSAMPVTRYLPARLRKNLGRGLDALYQEYMNNRRAGYDSDNTEQMRRELTEDATQAYALGIINYLPEWAKEND